MTRQPTGLTAVQDVKAVDGSLMMKVFYAFAAMALLSVVISIGGKWLGRSIAMAGHTDDPTLHEIVIGNNVIVAPANAIRFERARRDGVASRLDLYLRWPDMTGYSEAARDDFNHAGGRRNILFLSFEPRMMSRDMSGRFAPIYSAMIRKPGDRAPGGVTLYRFTEASGYANEMLAVAEQPGREPFVARCIGGDGAEDSLAPCERDIQLGDELSLTYRFPKELLPGWRVLDASVRAQASRYLKTAH